MPKNKEDFKAILMFGCLCLISLATLTLKESKAKLMAIVKMEIKFINL